MLSVRLSRESLSFYRQSKMNSKSLNPSVPVACNDIHQESGNFGFESPVAPKTRASRKKKTETELEIKGATPLQAADELHKRFPKNVLYNTPSRLVQIALQEPEGEPNRSKKKGVKVKRKESSPLPNNSKAAIEEIEKVKIGQKRDTRQRTKPDAIKQSSDNTEELVMTSSEPAGPQRLNPLLQNVTEPATKRPRTITNLKNSVSTMESDIAANIATKRDESNQILDAKNRSAENTEELVMTTSEPAVLRRTNPLSENVSEPATKRPRIISNVESFVTTIESVISRNVSESEESDQSLEESLEGKTIFEARPKELPMKSAVIIGTEPLGSNRSVKKSTVSANNATELEEFSDISDGKPANNGKTNGKLGVPANHAARSTKQLTALPKRSLSTKQSLEKNSSKSGPMTSGPNDESLSVKVADTDKSSESEDDTCSSESYGELDPIFSRRVSPLKKRSSIFHNARERSRKEDKTSESSPSPEIGLRKKSSNHLPGLVLPSPRKQLSFSEDYSAANRDISGIETEKHAHTKGKALKSVRSKTLLENVPSLTLETSRISANTSTPKEGSPRKLVANAEFTPVTSHLSENMKPSNGSPTSKRKGSTSFTNALSPNKQHLPCRNTSPHDQPPIDADKDTLEEVQEKRSEVHRTEESMLESTNNRMTLSSSSDPYNADPMPIQHSARFNLYMAPPGYPVRARQIISTEDFVVSWLELQPKVIFPLQTSFRTMIMRLKGSVEFRSDPFVPSRTLVNSVAKIVELEAVRLFHIVNTGEEVALIQMTEVLR